MQIQWEFLQNWCSLTTVGTSSGTSVGGSDASGPFKPASYMAWSPWSPSWDSSCALDLEVYHGLSVSCIQLWQLKWENEEEFDEISGWNGVCHSFQVPHMALGSSLIAAGDSGVLLTRWTKVCRPLGRWNWLRDGAPTSTFLHWSIQGHGPCFELMRLPSGNLT